MNAKTFINTIKKDFNVSYFDLAYIFEKTLKINKQELLFLENINKDDEAKILKVLNELKNGKPLNKIFNEQNFYGLDFYINENVLAPRSDTEILVERAINEIQNQNLDVLDLCCGSGVIGLTVKYHCKNANITLGDISEKALEVCLINKQKFNLDVNIIKSDLFENIQNKFDYILSNPPYIKLSDKEKLDKEVLDYDPHIALFGGDDGLLFYKRILEQTHNFLKENGKILFEIGYDICDEVCLLAKDYNIEIVKDLNNINRVLVLTKKELL